MLQFRLKKEKEKKRKAKLADTITSLLGSLNSSHIFKLGKFKFFTYI